MLKIMRLFSSTYSDKKEKSDKRFSPFVALCRNEATRTPDPYVPNVVRYQLRYIPSLITPQRYSKKIEK